jgi:hypothetical protein
MSKDVVDFILGRLSEASTYAGLGAMLGGLHLTVSGDELNAIVGVLMALAGAVGIVLKEKGLA